jgi:hypothetical protein
MQLSHTWDRSNPGFPGKWPGERNLTMGCLLALGDLLKQINQLLIRPSVLRIKARDGVAEIRSFEGRGFFDLACEETLSQWAEGSEADSKRICPSAAGGARKSLGFGD